MGRLGLCTRRAVCWQTQLKAKRADADKSDDGHAACGLVAGMPSPPVQIQFFATTAVPPGIYFLPVVGDAMASVNPQMELKWPLTARQRITPVNGNPVEDTSPAYQIFHANGRSRLVDEETPRGGIVAG